METTPNEISSWDVDGVFNWAKTIIDEESAVILKNNKVNGKALLLVTQEMLERWGMIGGPALLLSHAISSIKGKQKDLSINEDVDKFHKALQTTPDDIPPNTILQLKNPFTTNTLLARVVYFELIDLLYNQPEHLPNALILGNPGIGKTCFLVFLLIALLKKNKTVIYYSLHQPGKVYCFKEKKTYLGKSPNKFSKELSNPDTWFLVDTIDNPGMFSARTVLVASPQKSNSKQFIKYSKLETYYMPAWNFEELSSVAPYYKMEDCVKEKFLTFGGIPRSVFDSTKGSEIRLEETISNSSLKLCIDCIGKPESDTGISHFVICICPIEKYSRKIIQFASQRIAYKVVERLQKVEHNNLINFLRYKENMLELGAFQGHVFQGYANYLISEGGTFKIRNLKLKSYQIDELVIKRRKIQYVSDFTCIDDHYYVPTQSNFNAVDSWTKDGYFQITISNNHPERLFALYKLMKANIMYNYDIPQKIKLNSLCWGYL